MEQIQNIQVVLVVQAQLVQEELQAEEERELQDKILQL
jgi:hypothetical protein